MISLVYRKPRGALSLTSCRGPLAGVMYVTSLNFKYRLTQSELIEVAALLS